MASGAPARFEFDLLAYLAGKDGVTVRQAHDEFGRPRNYVRGTTVKAIDRLLKKGLVQREAVQGVYVYRAVQAKHELDRQLVSSFVRERLDGKLGPLAAYFADNKDLDPEELKKLKEVLDQLDP